MVSLAHTGFLHRTVSECNESSVAPDSSSIERAYFLFTFTLLRRATAESKFEPSKLALLFYVGSMTDQKRHCNRPASPTRQNCDLVNAGTMPR